MQPTVYIETTIISYLKARPSRDIVIAAHQQITKDWWTTQRGGFRCFTSALTRLEAGGGDSAAAAEHLAVIQSLPLVAVPNAAENLARALIAATAMPQVAARDALHVALAAANGIDILLTWNCRHLANVILRPKIEQICGDIRFKAPLICTPEELLGAET